MRPLGGGAPIGYTRVTTIAKALDEGGGLAPWKAAMAVVGTFVRPGIRAEWEALIAEHHGDPWYSGEEGKAACKRLVEKSAEAGGSGDRRDIGLSLHAITAQLDATGAVPTHLSPATEADLTAYVNALAAAGVSICHNNAVETTVVLDEWQVGGTFDRLVNVRGFALPMIADIKTGADLQYSWQSFAVQLAAYSRARAIYRQGDAADGSEDERTPMPQVDQSRGLVIWLPAGEARCELHMVDLHAGWEAFELSMKVREWRKRRDLSEPYTGGDDLAVKLATSVGNVTGDYTPAIRAWLQDRIDTIGKYSDLSRADLLRSWPVDVPTLAKFDGHTAEQLAVIERVCDDVESRHSMPFGLSKPGPQPEPREWLQRMQSTFPGSTIQQEQPS